MKCKRHQWDYITNARIGESFIAVENPYYACWICPYCNSRKKLMFEKGAKL